MTHEPQGRSELRIDEAHSVIRTVPRPPPLAGDAAAPPAVPSLADYLATIAEGRWLVLGTLAVAVVLWAGYAFLKAPIYRSDFVAQVSLTAYKNWNVEAGIQWNPEDTRSERSQFRLQYRPGNDRVINLAYRAQHERLEQADVSAAWPIGNKWNAFGRVVYSLRDSSTLERFAGLEYKACCYRLRAVVRRFISSSDGTQETGFQLQLELKGLASVGTDADDFLGRSIRGYSPESSRR